MHQGTHKQYLLEKYLKLSAMRILSNRLVLLLFVGFLMTNCNDYSKKESARCVQRRSAEDSLYVLELKDAREKWSPFFDARLARPSLMDYDTVYWFRAQDSWGKFDDLCALYNVGNQWYTTFVGQQWNSHPDSCSITVSVPFKKVQHIRFLLDSMGVYCYPVEVDTMGLKDGGYTFDVPTYHYVIKEGGSCHFFRWGPYWGPGLMGNDTVTSVLNLLFLTAEMLPDTIFQKPEILYQTERLDNNNFTIDYLVRNMSYHFIKGIEINTDAGPMPYTLYSDSRVNRREIKALGNIYATIEFWNGQKTPQQLVKKE